jgi:hypothetical protein
MTLYQFLRSLGFDHDDVVVGLLPDDPGARLAEKAARIAAARRAHCAALVKRRRRIEELQVRIGARKTIPKTGAGESIDRRRLERCEAAYGRRLAVVAHLGKLHGRVCKQASGA